MSARFIIKQPETEAEFKHYYHLRWKLLRAPWKQAEGSEVDALEHQCFHLMAVKSDQATDSNANNEVIAVARLQFNSETQAQIRYMAVEKRHERQGIGRQLMTAMENHARDNGRQQIVLDAREHATPFYKKLGYQIIKKSYLLFDEIQHYRMLKDLVDD